MKMNSKFGMIINKCSDSMVIVNHKGIVCFANPAAENLFGKSAEQMLGKPFGFKVGSESTVRLKIPFKKREPKVAEMRITSIEWEEKPAWLASINDITELVRLEHLKMEISERRRLDLLKDEFIGTVSHEIRTPLTIVKGAVSNLKDGLVGALSEKQFSILDMISRNVDRLTKIINNLLDLSRLESGKVQMNSFPLNVEALVLEALQNFRVLAIEKKLEVQSDFGKNLPLIHADGDMLTQVLHNLLDNALRFAYTKVVVRVGIIDKRGRQVGKVQISVIDDGPGISPEKVGILFSKFVQLERPKGGEGYKGTGLGLVICKQIIDQHGGKIWVESILGEGSQFHLRIPIAGKVESKKG
ncbi:MAG: PAS domain-containing sensor histidine kinase [Deltaproteobacteria bacterium]|nr:PAS domain-containing sensor histidine kinase [Deltaproteobacteria bacterium]